MASLFDDRRVTCPYCLGRRQICCRCQSRGSVAWIDAERLVRWLWDVESCPCDTCQYLRNLRMRIPQ